MMFWLGLFLIVVPLLLMLVCIWIEDGWLGLVAFILFSVLMIGSIVGGIYVLTHYS